MGRGSGRTEDEASSHCPSISFKILNEIDRTAAINAAVTEIGSASLGLHLKEPLKVGQILKFTEGKNLRRKLPSKGTVMWTMKDSDGMKAGVRLS